MTTFKKGNTLKAVGVLIALFGFLTAMVLGPMANRPEVEGPEVNVPSMENVPPAGYFGVEVE